MKTQEALICLADRSCFLIIEKRQEDKTLPAVDERCSLLHLVAARSIFWKIDFAALTLPL